MKRLLFAIVAAGLLSACGSDSSPAAPAPIPASVAGAWSGTIQYTSSGSTQVQAIAFSLTQAGTTVNGTYGAQTFDGTVTGATTASSFSGTLTFNGKTVSGTSCTGTFAVSGPAGGSTLSWTSPAVSASCSNTPTAITIAIQRR